MLCERCKIREANIRYTEVFNGMKTEHNLCSQCAQETEFGHYAAMFDGEFPLSKLLSGLLGMETEETKEKKSKMDQVVCPVCHTSYNEFVKNSRFGCADCYSMFDLLISDNIKKLQGSDTHVGKLPKYQGEGKKKAYTLEMKTEKLTLEEELELLDSKLKEAIREEEFEIAAEYRDKIKLLKKGDEANA